jgi:hypothetical protein
MCWNWKKAWRMLCTFSASIAWTDECSQSHVTEGSVWQKWKAQSHFYFVSEKGKMLMLTSAKAEMWLVPFQSCESILLHNTLYTNRFPGLLVFARTLSFKLCANIFMWLT